MELWWKEQNRWSALQEILAREKENERKAGKWKLAGRDYGGKNAKSWAAMQEILSWENKEKWGGEKRE